MVTDAAKAQRPVGESRKPSPRTAIIGHRVPRNDKKVLSAPIWQVHSTAS